MFTVSEIIDFILLGGALVCALGAWITARKIIRLEKDNPSNCGDAQDE